MVVSQQKMKKDPWPSPLDLSFPSRAEAMRTPSIADSATSSSSGKLGAFDQDYTSRIKEIGRTRRHIQATG